MTMRWCVLTGALMLACVVATFTFKNVVQDTPGVYTRWYDGTTQRVDVFYPNGKLQSTTTYGEDGKTVIILVELTDEGAIVHSRVRREDGKVLEKRYSEDGKVMLFQTLWSGDGTYYLEQRQFFQSGTLRSETIMTENGAAPVSRKMFNPDGSLMMESHILNNADQEMKQYINGKMIHRSLFKANADQIEEFYNPVTDALTRRTTRVALTGDFTSEYFNSAGELVYSSTVLGAGTTNPFSSNAANNASQAINGTKPPEVVINSVYAKGKLILRQTGVEFLLKAVEEFTPGQTTPRRKIELDDNGHVITVSIYRTDGSLMRVKHLEGGVVTSQDDYDATGSKIIHKEQGGEPETISPDLLRPALPPTEGE